MRDPYIGQIALFLTGEVPREWLPCDGRAVSYRDIPALYAIIGDQYGGDTRSQFNLPDLRGRVPIGGGYEPAASIGTKVQAEWKGGDKQTVAEAVYAICVDGVFPLRR